MSRTARRPSSPSSRSEIYSPQSISRTSWGCATAPSSGCSPTPAPGASARLRQGDFQDHGPQRVFRSREKGGKEREIPVGLEFPILLVNPGSGSAKAAFVWRQQGDVSPFLGKIVWIPLSGVFGRRWRLTGDPRFRRPSPQKLELNADLLLQRSDQRPGGHVGGPPPWFPAIAPK